MEATVSTNKTKGLDARASLFNVQLSAPNIREDVEALAAMIQAETRVPVLSMSTAVAMAVREALERRRGKA